MPFLTSAKYALRKMTGASLVRDIDDGFAALADDVDAKMAGYVEGTFAARPAAAVAGRFYRATDTGKLYFDTGSTWLEMGFASTGFQPGDVKLISLTAVPAGWLLFNGQTVLRATYADLWTAAQVEIANGNPLYNTGNGTTTFGLADCRGQAVIMAGQGALLTNRPLGQSVGEEGHVLASGELPAHTHSVGTDSVWHRHDPTAKPYFVVADLNVTGVQVALGSSGQYAAAAGGNSGTFTIDSLTDIPNQGHTHAVTGGGSGQSHNNMQPSRAFSLLVKT